MSAADQYAAACWPDRWTILGVRLQPFCLGHALLLQRLRSPFLGALPGTPSPAELARLYSHFALAIAICARSVQENIAALHKPLRLRWRWLAFCLHLESLIRPAALFSRVLLFRAYIDAHLAGPKAWSIPAAREPGAPSFTVIKIILMAELGYSEQAALAMPLGQAFWETMCLREIDGRARLVNEIEAEMIASNEADQMAAAV